VIGACPRRNGEPQVGAEAQEAGHHAISVTSVQVARATAASTHAIFAAHTVRSLRVRAGEASPPFFGRRTDIAVKTFQNQIEVEVDGKAGMVTLQKLDELLVVIEGVPG